MSRSGWVMPDLALYSSKSLLIPCMLIAFLVGLDCAFILRISLLYSSIFFYEFLEANKALSFLTSYFQGSSSSKLNTHFPGDLPDEP